MKKFELTDEYIANEFGVKLYRIKALIDFGNVKAMELGGYVEKEANLSQNGNAWVYGNAKVYENAWVCGDAKVSGNAEVYGDARVYGNAKVSGNAWVSGDAEVYGNARVYGDAEVYGNAKVCGNAWVCGNADYATAKGFGSAYRTTTFFRTKCGGVDVSCGCFHGTLKEFRGKVKETHGNRKTAKEYLMLADLMEYRFQGEEEKTGSV